MKINRLRLLNFRCFQDYELTLSDRFTLLIGDNGTGKTTILDALAISTDGFLLGIPETQPSDRRTISRDDARHNLQRFGQSTTKEIESDISLIKAIGIVDDKTTEWSRYKDYKTHHEYDVSQISYDNRIIELAENLAKQRSNPKIFFPVIGYYGTGRLWKNIDSFPVETLSPDSRLVGYRACLNPASNLEQLFRWFKTQELAALQKNETRHVLEAVRNAIAEMIPGAKRAWWDVDWDEILIESDIQGKIQTIPFHLLSDGYRNMIGMVADIAYRMATLNPQLEADVIKQTQGIVLIDEIDLHLHPKWQREVVGRLLNTFPKVQFVASSHSPFIIQSLYGRDDCLLWDLEKAAPLSIESKSIEDIAENQQGVEIPQQSQRFLAMEKVAIEYYETLQGLRIASDEEKQRLKQKLDDLLEPYSDNPAFQAFLKMERQAAEGNTNAS